ncbi:hypothetical protein [Halorussus lipolyticus]|uniref:hypothetical protein n=1 Tax=Halorussus lipolyticus TaxID=3034024 RepID=UPI0023E80F54|nr:hypothetical protein [Halorussus sp. DT80]
MADKPDKKQLLDSIAKDDSGADHGRRKVLQSGAVAALASAVGLGSVAGSASASGQSDDFEVAQKTASRNRLKNAELLLEELADQGLISRASPSAFSNAPLGKNDTGSAVLKYGEQVVHTFVVRSNGTKLTINLPEGGDPYAIYAPDGSGPGKRVRFDQIKGTVETTEMEYTQDVSATSECGSTCGGSTCSPAGNCWLEDRECTESCRQDNAGDYYCHDNCYCGC